MSQEQNKRLELRQYGDFLQSIRNFMREEDILEVVTNPFMPKVVPDRGVDPIQVQVAEGDFYLHTSPEWEMKKLLAGGSGSIYQMVNVFRDDVYGRWHKPAFMMLEWYTLGVDDDGLISQCVSLFEFLGLKEKPVIISCRELYQQYCGIDIVDISIKDLENWCIAEDLPYESLNDKAHQSAWLELIWVNKIEPNLLGLMVVKDFPVSQCALAKIDQSPYPRARRFEVIYHGCEIANGYFEEQDVETLNQRFIASKGACEIVNAEDIRKMPMCSGVSIGVERLYAVYRNQTQLSQI